MIRKILFVLCLLCGVQAYANDGIFFTNGNQLVPLTETDISVKKEVLTITLCEKEYAHVDVYYEFYNPNSISKTIKMGFEADPSYNDDWEFHKDGVHPNIKNFTVEFNNVKLPYKNAVSLSDKPFAPLNPNEWKLDDDGGQSLLPINVNDDAVAGDSFAYVYYFDATFKPGINRVHHTYTYKMSIAVGTEFEIPYKLSPAARWANHQIDDFTLYINVNDGIRYFNVWQLGLPGIAPKFTSGTGKMREVKSWNGKVWQFVVKNGTLQFHADNFRPVGGIEGELFIQSADVDISYNDKCRFGDYYSKYSSEQLFMWTNEGYGKEDIKVSRKFFKKVAVNLPYAFRGHVFKDKQLKEFFESVWWYIPDLKYKDDTSDFTPTDWEYVNYGKKK